LDIILFVLDFILHVDTHLAAFVASYGPWVYALLFLIVFVETGVVVMPFLPGDSLLFVVGALSGAGLLDFPLACGILLAAAILGDQCNYTIGRYFGPKVFGWENSRWFNRRAFDRAHAFMNAGAVSPWCWRALCPLFVPLPRLWPGWRRWGVAGLPPGMSREPSFG